MKTQKPVNVEERLRRLEARGIQDRGSIESLLKRLERAPEKTFTREEVREMLIGAAYFGNDSSNHETFEEIADRVLREAGR